MTKRDRGGAVAFVWNSGLMGSVLFLTVACGGGGTSAPNVCGRDGSFTTLVRGECVCEAGYEWKSPGQPGDYQCVPAGTSVPQCEPVCASRQCGDDGCGGSCGTCGTGTTCSADGQCQGPTCTADCTGRQCGDDGCDGSCGSCPPGHVCTPDGHCQGPTCSPDCAGRQCGDDGCGESCGTCGTGMTCSADGQCQGPTCTADCTGRQCGDDGCGGSCGECLPGHVCTPDGHCQGDTDPPSGDGFPGDACETNDDCQGLNNACILQDGFLGGYCTQVGCDQIDCLEGAACMALDGGDGAVYYLCLDTCSAPSDCREGYTCVEDANVCWPPFDDTCTPDCAGRQCGDDGCGGSCGECFPGQACTLDGLCENVANPPSGDGLPGDACETNDDCQGPNNACIIQDEFIDGYCTRYDCNSTGCPDGSDCMVLEDVEGSVYHLCLAGCSAPSDCREGYTCVEDAFVCWPPFDDTCTPDCTGRQCGDDGCGGSCGECLPGHVCSPEGLCHSDPDPPYGNGRPGDACETSDDCQGPNNACIIQDEFLDGYCTRHNCNSSGCPDGSDCMVLEDVEGGVHHLCLASCSEPTDCREGYTCAEEANVCWPPFDDTCTPDCTGRQCGDDGCGGSCGECLPGHVCSPEGHCHSDPDPPSGDGHPGHACEMDDDCLGPNNACINQEDFPGGYCIQYDCHEYGCSVEGSECMILEDVEGGLHYLCLASCSAPADCREGYTCIPEQDVCWPDIQDG